MRRLKLVYLGPHELHFLDLSVHYMEKIVSINLLQGVHSEHHGSSMCISAMMLRDWGCSGEACAVPDFHFHPPVLTHHEIGSERLTLVLVLGRTASLLLKLRAHLLEQLVQTVGGLLGPWAWAHAAMRVVHVRLPSFCAMMRSV